MSVEPTVTGEAHNEEFVPIFSREILNNGRDAFFVKVLLFKGQPQINILKTYYNFKERKWLPGKGSLFFKLDAWHCFSIMINPLIDEIEKMGLSGTKVSSFLAFHFTIL